MVTAELGPFDREGSSIDVSVSAVGDADSLQGGTLLATPLKGLDGQVYAVAEGAISIGGWTASGEKASVTKGHQTVGRIPNGAIVEKQELSTYFEKGTSHHTLFSGSNALASVKHRGLLYTLCVIFRLYHR